MRNLKINKIFAIGILMYSFSSLVSHISFLANLLGSFNDFLAGAGCGLIVVGLIPKAFKEKVRCIKNKLFLKI